MRLVWFRNHLGVVGSSSDSDITSLGNVLDSHCRSSLAGHPNPRSRGARTTADFEKVIGGSGGSLPGLAGVCADLELGGTALGVDDLSREPVLRDTGFHVDGKRSGNGADDVVPGHRNDSLRFRGQVGEGVLIEIKVVGTTSRALVGNHCGDALAVGSLHGHLLRSNSQHDLRRSKHRGLTQAPQLAALLQLESERAVP